VAGTVQCSRRAVVLSGGRDWVLRDDRDDIYLKSGGKQLVERLARRTLRRDMIAAATVSSCGDRCATARSSRAQRVWATRGGWPTSSGPEISPYIKISPYISLTEMWVVLPSSITFPLPLNVPAGHAPPLVDEMESDEATMVVVSPPAPTAILPRAFLVSDVR
jgi:hypothetical protein